MPLSPKGFIATYGASSVPQYGHFLIITAKFYLQETLIASVSDSFDEENIQKMRFDNRNAFFVFEIRFLSPGFSLSAGRFCRQADRFSSRRESFRPVRRKTSGNCPY